MSSSQPEIAGWADQFERGFHGGAWHGPALEEAIAKVPAELSAQRPAGSPHSILELVHHLAFWIETADARIQGRELSGGASDWSPPQGGEAGWERARARLGAAHHALHASILRLEDAALDQPVAGSDPTLRGMLFGVLQHNAYHAGQIVALARRLGVGPQ
jgi:uncharacterized damage-inducible protein DinB